MNKINWIINKNEFWQLIGPNGSGKTIILSIIYGNTVKAYEQKVYLFGRKKGSWESVWEMKEKIGYFSPAMLELFQRQITIREMVISGFFGSTWSIKNTYKVTNSVGWRMGYSAWLRKCKRDFF